MNEDAKPKRRNFPKTPQELADAGLMWHVVVDGKRKPATKEEALEYCIEMMVRLGANAPRTEEEMRKRPGWTEESRWMASFGRYYTEEMFPTPDDFWTVLGLLVNHVWNDRDLSLRITNGLKETESATLAIPTNAIVNIGLEAIMAGGPKAREKGFWVLQPELQTARFRKASGTNGEVVVWVDPKGEAESAVWTMEQIETYIKSLSPFTMDVALAVLSRLADGTNAPLLEPVLVDAESIIRQKDIKAWGRQREALRVNIEQEMENLQRLKFDVHKIKGKDPDTGKWNQAISWRNDRMFDIVTIEAYQRRLFDDGKDVVAVKWTVRAGQWAYYFLSPQARRWVCGMARVLLALSHRADRRGEQLAKKIGVFVFQNGWKLGKGQPLQWTLETLFGCIAENPRIEEHKGRFREAFESAIELLRDKGVFKEITFSPGYAEDIDRGRGWVERWLQYQVTFTFPETTEIERQLQLRQVQRALAPSPRQRRRSTPRRDRKTLVNGMDIRKARADRNIFQEDLARQLGISREHLSRIESGKALPSEQLNAKMKYWLEALDPIF